MKTKTKKPKINIVLPIILVSSALIALFNFKDKISPKTTNKINDNNSSNQNINQRDEDINTPIFQNLSVLTNHCRGCGKCTRLDPQHFELIDGKASVVSTTNLDSPALKLAINNCPDQAIILE
jgi:ferredoxin